MTVFSDSVLHALKVETLRLLDLLSVHLTTSCLSLTATRSFDSSRVLAAAGLAAIADAVLRKVATDVPDQFVLEYRYQPFPSEWRTHPYPARGCSLDPGSKLRLSLPHCPRSAATLTAR